VATGTTWFKAAVFALLVCNTTILLSAGTASEALDAAAWLVLLASFELETGYGGRFRAGRKAAILRGARLVAAAAIAVAAIGYVRGEEWLDAINLGLWIAVVALLEFEVRRPDAVAAHRARFTAVATLLYCGLGVPVLVWAGRGEWFDAYDALLWLVAFATIEIDLFRFARRATTGSPSG
jgi:hypothetical protein